MLLFTFSLFGEVIIIYESASEYRFDKDGLIIFEKEGIFTYSKSKNVMTYDEYFKQQCNGRDFDIITGNIGVKYGDNFVINCKGKNNE